MCAFAMTCHVTRLFVCISVCHAANDPETYKVVFALVCARSSDHLQWFVSVHLGIQCTGRGNLLLTVHHEGVK